MPLSPSEPQQGVWHRMGQITICPLVWLDALMTALRQKAPSSLFVQKRVFGRPALEAVGKLSNPRVLATPLSWQFPFYQAVREAAEKLNIPLRLEPLQSPIDEAEYRRAFESMQRDHVDGVMLSSEPESYTYRRLLGRLAREYRVPTICWY